jgi:hypothetical protein
LFSLSFLDNKCNSKFFHLQDSNKNNILTFKLNLISDYKLFNYFTDFSTDNLNLFVKKIDNRLIKLSLVSKES